LPDVPTRGLGLAGVIESRENVANGQFHELVYLFSVGRFGQAQRVWSVRALGPHRARLKAVSGPADVDKYLDALPADSRACLQEMRRQIKAAAPHATESIAYGMPAFRLGKRFLVSYDAYQSHCSLFPASEGIRQALGKELESHFAGKGTIHFKPSEPLPADVVRQIIEIRLREVAG
jgi:uncharacterized protein YdhG (YjbR/CyaY superfamily)